MAKPTKQTFITGDGNITGFNSIDKLQLESSKAINSAKIIVLSIIALGVRRKMCLEYIDRCVD